MVKAMVVSVAKSRDMIPSGKVERGERKQTADDVSKVVQVMSKPRVGQSGIPGPQSSAVLATQKDVTVRITASANPML